MPVPDPPSSPEMLHQRIRLIAAPTWVPVVVLLGAMAAATVWGVLGAVHVQVTGRGLLVHRESQQIPVHAPTQGWLRAKQSATDEEVRAGQVLFEIELPRTAIELDDARKRLEDLEAALETVTHNAAEVIGNQERIFTDQLAALDQQRTQLMEQANFYDEELTNFEALRARGFTTLSSVQSMRERRDDATLRLVQLEATRAQVESDFLLSRLDWQRRVIDARLEVSQQRATIAELEEEFRRGTTIIAERDGYLREILVADGQLVAAGARLAVLETRQQGYEVLTFFDPLDGKRLAPGMEADVDPSTVSREEYGTMVGAVGTVTAQPVSFDKVVELLGNETLAYYITGDDPPIVARISLGDEFVWRNGSGPPFLITAGTLADVSVTVQTQAPITLVLPYLRSLAGW